MMDNIVPGKRYQFEDGNYIEVVQIKYGEMNGDNTNIVTYLIGSPKGLPRKLVMDMGQFVSNFGHLFE